ncbi:MAG TPA: response regulator [Candidatus Methylomirabilis sp.]|nr:response regulator [Candidatus Methylomirabilis sp.]
MASILVVDDEPANLDLLEALLTPAGYRVRTASGPIPALSAVKEAPPDLVLLDLMMPGMTGFEVCGRLRAEPRTARIPVIIVSAVSELGSRERAQLLAADDYLAKPIQSAEVLERVGALLRARFLRQQMDQSLAELYALETGRRAHWRRVLAGMAGSAAGDPREEGNAVILLMQDAKGSRDFSGDLTREQGGQVVRASGPQEELEARIRTLGASAGG